MMNDCRGVGQGVWTIVQCLPFCLFRLRIVWHLRGINVMEDRVSFFVRACVVCACVCMCTGVYIHVYLCTCVCIDVCVGM